MLLMFIVHHLEALPLIVQFVLNASQPPGNKALKSQVKKYNVSLQQRCYYIFLVIQGRLMSLRKPLISHIVAQKNLYASQNGLNFVTNDVEMKAFLGMNSVMSTNKLPSIEYCWSIDKYIGKQGLRDVTTKSRFNEKLSNIHFSDNETADSNDKGNKVRPLIDHFNEVFQSALANYSNQSIDEHM